MWCTHRRCGSAKMHSQCQVHRQALNTYIVLSPSHLDTVRLKRSKWAFTDRLVPIHTSIAGKDTLEQEQCRPKHTGSRL